MSSKSPFRPQGMCLPQQLRAKANFKVDDRLHTKDTATELNQRYSATGCPTTAAQTFMNRKFVCCCSRLCSLSTRPAWLSVGRGALPNSTPITEAPKESACLWTCCSRVHSDATKIEWGASQESTYKLMVPHIPTEHACASSVKKAPGHDLAVNCRVQCK